MDASLEQTADGPRLRFTRSLAHPPEKVWRAISEPEHLEAWWPGVIEVEEWRVGARVHFEPGAGFSFDGEVTGFDPPRMLELRWGPDTIRLEVEPDGQGTRLTLLDTLEEVGKAARDAAGWHTCLDQLEHHLDGTEMSASAGERWREVHPSYVEALGPEAATIGPPEGALD